MSKKLVAPPSNKLVAGSSIKLVDRAGAVRFEVRAKPRAKKSRIEGTRGDAALVALAAPPVDGAANDELVRLLSEVLGIPQRQIAIIRGQTSTQKVVEVTGLDLEVVRARLGGGGSS